MDLNVSSTATITVTGNIRRADRRETRNGTDVFEIAVPVDGSRDGDPTVWYAAPFFGERAGQEAGRYQQGDIVSITGRPEPRAYINKDGDAVVEVSIPFASVAKLRNVPRDDDSAASDEDYGGDVQF